ncbi:MAG: ABC transporter substrate-binding protein [Clostridiales bacterium]|nr:ABC transporter substrate-binding protein [Clostridiales bacterium]
MMKIDRKIKKVWALFLVMVLALGFTACGSANSGDTSGTEETSDVEESTQGQSENSDDLPEKIGLGYWDSPNGELHTKERGALEEAFPEIEIQWLEFDSGPDILTAMESGSIDFATIGTPPTALGLANGYHFKIFYLHDIIGESEGLIVTEDSGIESLEDLKGKSIATLFGSTSHYSLLNALESAGIEESDLTLYDMTAQDIFAAWQRGDLDGAYIWESVKSQLINNGGTEIISSEQLAEQGSITAEAGIVSNDFYEKYPEIVEKYIEILDESVQLYRDEPDESAELMAYGLNLTEEETLVSMNEIIVKDQSEQLEYLGQDGVLAQVLKDTADFLYDQNELSEIIDISVYQDAILTELYE